MNSRADCCPPVTKSTTRPGSAPPGAARPAAIRPKASSGRSNRARARSRACCARSRVWVSQRVGCRQAATRARPIWVLREPQGPTRTPPRAAWTWRAAACCSGRRAPRQRKRTSGSARRRSRMAQGAPAAAGPLPARAGAPGRRPGPGAPARGRGAAAAPQPLQVHPLGVGERSGGPQGCGDGRRGVGQAEHGVQVRVHASRPLPPRGASSSAGFPGPWRGRLFVAVQCPRHRHRSGRAAPQGVREGAAHLACVGRVPSGRVARAGLKKAV